jgi:hypothetical protein
MLSRFQTNGRNSSLLIISANIAGSVHDVNLSATVTRTLARIR